MRRLRHARRGEGLHEGRAARGEHWLRGRRVRHLCVREGMATGRAGEEVREERGEGREEARQGVVGEEQPPLSELAPRRGRTSGGQ